MTKQRLGIALGSGSARGWAHIGVLKSLRRAGIEPDVVCGCSMGALVGAAYACGKLDALHDFAENLTTAGVISLLDIALSGGGLINGKSIVDLLLSLGVSGPIEKCDRTFAGIATDLETGREVWMPDGPIEEVVRASISIPGIFNPVRRGQRWLADGGLSNPVPVSLCRALGAEVIIAVHVANDAVAHFEVAQADADKGVSPETLGRLAEQAPAFLRQPVAAVLGNLFPPPVASPAYFDVLLNSISIMGDQIARSRLAGEPPHVLLVPRLGGINPMEFQRAKAGIAEGYDAMEQALPVLRRHLGLEQPSESELPTNSRL